jgi:hypothetical protein
LKAKIAERRLSSIKKVAVPIADFGMLIAECGFQTFKKIFFTLGAFRHDPCSFQPY